MSSSVMNADFTNANVNGHSAQVLVLASPVNGAVMYIGKEKKGHEGIKDTPLEDYVGTVVHDHDRTFYRYGTRHQECTQHDCRYLIASKENPPSKYYREGHNLSVRLREYKENELLFLHDKRVPANNSMCERLARVYKRKQKQAMVLQSQKNLEYICDGLSTVYLLRANAENVYEGVAAIFERSLPPKSKKEVLADALL